VHGIRCYDNIAPRVLTIDAHDSIAATVANAKCQRVHACTRSMPGYITRRTFVWRFITSAKERICFRRCLSVCLSVCLFVCLFVC